MFESAEIGHAIDKQSYDIAVADLREPPGQRASVDQTRGRERVQLERVGGDGEWVRVGAHRARVTECGSLSFAA